MRQVTDPIWGRYRLTSSADAGRKCRRKSVTATNQQINARGNSKAVSGFIRLSHHRDSVPILGNGARWVTAAPRRAVAQLNSVSFIRSIVRDLLRLFFREFPGIGHRVVLYSSWTGCHDVR